MDPQAKSEIEFAKADAQAKLAELPARLKAENEAAIKERRRPYNIAPITAIKSDHVVTLCGMAKNPSPEVAAIIAVQSKSCAEFPGTEVGLLSVQLLAIINAAEASSGAVPG